MGELSSIHRRGEQPDFGESRGGASLLAHPSGLVRGSGGGAASRLERPTADLARLDRPNPAVDAPPSTADAPSPASAFVPLTPQERRARRELGVSSDEGPLTSELFQTLSPTQGQTGLVRQPPNFRVTVAQLVSDHLRHDIPDLTPADAPDPMEIAQKSAERAMPLIHSYYAPHAPQRTPSQFMSMVSRTDPNFGDPIRNRDAKLGEFLSWYAGARRQIRDLTADKRGVNRGWWNRFARWLRHGGQAFDQPPHQIRERAAVFDTYNTSITNARNGTVQLGRGFEPRKIPHTVIHEAMHLFEHNDLLDQSSFIQNRGTRDVFTEGFTEYLSRALTGQVVDALQQEQPPPFTPDEALRARVSHAYQGYVEQVIELRDTLYRHGQDGEEAIRRAFFLGEGWRFALLENSGTSARPRRQASSPIESDRALPDPVDVHFGFNSARPTDADRLAEIAAYARSRSVAKVHVVGRTDPTGPEWAHAGLGRRRALVVKRYLARHGVARQKVQTESRGQMDQIPGGGAANRRATATVVDPRNEAPGEPQLGR